MFFFFLNILVIRTYEDNTLYRNLIAEKLMPVRQIISLDIGGGESKYQKAMDTYKYVNVMI